MLNRPHIAHNSVINSPALNDTVHEKVYTRSVVGICPCVIMVG